MIIKIAEADVRFTIDSIRKAVARLRVVQDKVLLTQQVEIAEAIGMLTGNADGLEIVANICLKKQI